ncbi:MAG: hypothetical protein FWD47_01950 [Treponema sp.]|nr:hypothetical protein [Treponema sp.]
MENDELPCGNRPNSKYKLSKTNNDLSAETENLNFHYNRERRLANAPQSVKDLYNEQKQSRFGVFKALVADKPRRTLFIIIIFMCVGILMLSRFGFFDKTYILDGNKIDIKGTFFEETTLITLRKTAQNENAYTGHVDIAVSQAIDQTAGEPADMTSNIFYHRIYFSFEKEEEYRFITPYYGPVLLMVLQNEKNNLQIKFSPE